MFQSLIGTLQTLDNNPRKNLDVKFQSLIGTLQTYSIQYSFVQPF
jgi:hypothetical protein